MSEAVSAQVAKAIDNLIEALDEATGSSAFGCNVCGATGDIDAGRLAPHEDWCPIELGMRVLAKRVGPPDQGCIQLETPND